jgi:hypothetical protein
MPAAADRCAWYPVERRDAKSKNCPCCGRFLRWDDHYGQWIYHEYYDTEYGWQPTCV